MNSFQFTLKNSRRQALAQIHIVVPVGRRQLGRVAMERRFRSALGGRLANAEAPRTPLRLVALATGAAGSINEPVADQVLSPVPENGAVRVVLGPLDGARRDRLVTRYRLRDGHVVVAESGEGLLAAAADNLTTWLAAA
jgi:hypothetical protein